MIKHLHTCYLSTLHSGADLASEVTGHPVKFECNIWDTIILRKKTVSLKFKFNWVLNLV